MATHIEKNTVTEHENGESSVVDEYHNFFSGGLPIQMTDETARTEDAVKCRCPREVVILLPYLGEGDCLINGERVTVHVGEISVVNAGFVYTVVSDGLLRYYALHIDADFFAENGFRLQDGIFDTYIENPNVIALMRQIVDEYREGRKYRQQMLRSYLLSLVVMLFRNHFRSLSTISGERRIDMKINHSVGYIKYNFRRPIFLDDLANEAGLSKFHYSREFKRVTGMSPMEYLNRCRCEYGKVLLDRDNASIAEVAEASGFSSSAHFSRAFCRVFGVLPSAYQRHHRTISD